MLYSTLNILLLKVTVLIGVCIGGETGRLLKIPRIYNALITTDEDLLPSQAYPAVSPVLHPTSHIYVEHKDIAPLTTQIQHQQHHQQHQHLQHQHHHHEEEEEEEQGTVELDDEEHEILPKLPQLPQTPPQIIAVPPPNLNETPNVKNHRPADPAIPDVPPPPLPVSFKNR